MSVRLITGNAIERLRLLPSESVHCCVTSPPYYGLRDYGVDGQIGLEPSPDAYIAALVAVFREVGRVLRPDATLWLNIGDSYASGGRVNYGPLNPGDKQATQAAIKSAMRPADPLGIKPKDLLGIPWMLAFALRQPWTDWQIKTEAMRAWVAGIVDGEGCITILRTKSSHCDSLSFPPVVQVRMCDREPLDRLVEVAGSKIGEPQMPPTAAAANQRESWQWKIVSDKAAKVIAEIYPFLTCKQKQAIVAWNHQAFRAARGNQERKRGDLEKEQFCKDLINDMNQRRPVDIPSWMVEPRIVQEPGWYLRQDLIWAKPNPMPESVQDRCTKSHEYIFLLSKSERYWFDAAAIAEAAKFPEGSWGRTSKYDGDTSGKFRTMYGEGRRWEGSATRNKRSVWTVASEPFSEAHFATFPPALIEPCVLAGCPEKCCVKCGAPWVRKVEKTRTFESGSGRAGKMPIGKNGSFLQGDIRLGPVLHIKTLGFSPSCVCNAAMAPGVVLDPFAGAGTTGLAADRLGRNAILVELNPAYTDMARRRIEDDAGLFAQLEAAE